MRFTYVNCPLLGGGAACWGEHGEGEEEEEEEVETMMNDERVNGHTVCYHSVSNTCRNWTATAAQVSGVDCVASLKHGHKLFQPPHFKHQYKGSRKQFGTCTTHFVYIFSSTCSIMTHVSSAKLGGIVFAVGLTVPERLPVPSDFIMGVVGLLGYGTCVSDSVTSAALRKWHSGESVSPLWTRLCSAQDRNGLDWTGPTLLSL